MVSTLRIYEDLRETLDEQAARRIAHHLATVYEDLQQTATRQDVLELRSTVRELAEAQKATDATVKELALAQKRTEERVEELAQAQKRTEERVEELAQAQKRTEERVEELAQAQKRTEAAVKELAQGMEALRRQVGGLSETVGGDIEDIAYIVLHDVLKRELGWEVSPLERSWQRWDGAEQEIDIFGPAQDPRRPGVPIWIVGEAKHNLTLRQVERFTQVVAQARQHLQGEVFAVCFCYRARPEVQAAVKGAGIRLVFSFGRMA